MSSFNNINPYNVVQFISYWIYIQETPFRCHDGEDVVNGDQQIKRMMRRTNAYLTISYGDSSFPLKTSQDKSYWIILLSSANERNNSWSIDKFVVAIPLLFGSSSEISIPLLLVYDWDILYRLSSSEMFPKIDSFGSKFGLLLIIIRK